MLESMVINEQNFHVLIADLENSYDIGYDTETSGLGFHDRLFSLALATAQNSYYLNFNDKADHLGQYPHTILPKSYLGRLQFAMCDKEKLWHSHNAGFDNQKLELEGIKPPQNIHCTYVAERLMRNDSLDLTLFAVAQKYGHTKDERVSAYITEHRLYTQVMLPGKERKEKILHYDRVPFKIMAEYGETDARIHRAIGLVQRAVYQ